MPLYEGSFGDDRSGVATGVDALDGEHGEDGVRDSVRAFLNWDALEGLTLVLGGVAIGDGTVTNEGSPLGGAVSVIGEGMEAGTAGALGPMLVTSPFLSISSISFVTGSASSSLSPSCPPTS